MLSAAFQFGTCFIIKKRIGSLKYFFSSLSILFTKEFDEDQPKFLDKSKQKTGDVIEG